MAALHNNLPQLSATNFSNWKFRVECLLDEKQCKEVLEDEITEKCKELTPQDEKALHVKDAKARSIIVQCLTDRHIEYVKDAKSAYEMMKCLKNIFERKTILSKLYVRRKLLSLKCKDGTELEEHFQQFDRLIRELEETGSKMDESDKVCHLLLTMPSPYETTVTALETITDNLTVEFVKSRLLDAELKMKNTNVVISDSECSFSARERTNRRCFGCNGLGHFISNCPSKNTTPERGRGRGWFSKRGYGQGRPRYGDQEHQEIWAFFYEPDEELKEKKKGPVLETVVPYYMPKFEEVAAKNGGYFVGGKMTWADVYFAGIFDYLSAMVGFDLLEKCPKLTALKKTVESVPSIKAWVDKRPQTEF